MTIGEFRELLLALAEYADRAADMGSGEYNWDGAVLDVSRAYECAAKARKIEAEIEAAIWKASTDTVNLIAAVLGTR